jgi:hypothetical protein
VSEFRVSALPAAAPYEISSLCVSFYDIKVIVLKKLFEENMQKLDDFIGSEA